MTDPAEYGREFYLSRPPWNQPEDFPEYHGAIKDAASAEGESGTPRESAPRKMCELPGPAHVHYTRTGECYRDDLEEA